MTEPHDVEPRSAEASPNVARPTAAANVGTPDVDEKTKDAEARTSELILYPEYAIGQQLITRAEYDDIRNKYYVQGQAACGMVLPLLVLALACFLTDQVTVP